MMKRAIGAILFFGLSTTLALGQCSNTNTFLQHVSFPSGSNTVAVSCVKGGEYVSLDVIQGTEYIISTCANPAPFDTYLTLFEDQSGNYLTHQDDGCVFGGAGNGTTLLNWTSTLTGRIRISLNAYGCGSNPNCAQLQVTKKQADLALEAISMEPFVHSLPLNQKQAISFRGKIKNTGDLDVDSLVLTAFIPQQDTVSDTLHIPLQAGDSLNMHSPELQLPHRTGNVQTVVLVELLGQQDAQGQNDTLFRFLTLTDSTYALHSDTATGNSYGRGPIFSAHSDPFRLIGNRVHLHQKDTLTRVAFYCSNALGDLSEPVQVGIMSVSGTTPSITLLARSETIDSSLLKNLPANGAWLSARFGCGLQLDSGDYIIGPVFDAATGLSVATSTLKVPQGYTWFYDNGDAMWTDLAAQTGAYPSFMIEAIFNPLLPQATWLSAMDSTQTLCPGDSLKLEVDTHTANHYYVLHKDGQVVDSNTTGAFWVHTAGRYEALAFVHPSCSDTSSTIQVGLATSHPIQLVQQDSLLSITALPDTLLAIQWFRDSVALSGAGSSELLATDTGKYYAQVVDTSGCVSYSDTILYQPNSGSTSLLERAPSMGLQVYPNPTSGGCSVSGLHLHQPFSIISLQGQVMYRGKSNQKSVVLDLKDFPAGLYLLKQQSRVVRFIVQ